VRKTLRCRNICSSLSLHLLFEKKTIYSIFKSSLKKDVRKNIKNIYPFHIVPKTLLCSTPPSPISHIRAEHHNFWKILRLLQQKISTSSFKETLPLVRKMPALDKLSSPLTADAVHGHWTASNSN